MKTTAFIYLLLGYFCWHSLPLYAQIPYESILKRPASQLQFEGNKGQFAADILYQSEMSMRQIRFLDSALSIALVRETSEGGHVEEDSTHLPWEHKRWVGEYEGQYEALVWNLHLQGVRPEVLPTPYDPVDGKQNYISENGRVAGVQRYRELWYEGLYAGIDLRYYGTESHELKYDFILTPNSDVADIQLRTEGADSLALAADGSLEIHTAWGNVTEAKPYAYQMVRGQEIEIPVQYRLLDSHTFGFILGPRYDATQPVVLDPVTLSWSTFFHGSLSDDYMIAVHRDTLGYMYTTGYSVSANFPTTPGVYQGSNTGDIDVFVTKFSPNGAGLIYSTLIGGSNWEMAYGLDVNSAGEAYVAGFLTSANFPVTSGTFQAVPGGGAIEAFVFKLSANGDSLLFSSFFGGSDREYVYDLSLSSDESAFFMTGYTLSSNLPTTSGAADETYNGAGDGFVMKVSEDGSTLLYSTYIGGSSYEIGNDLIVSSSGETWVTGMTASGNFPITPDAYRGSFYNIPGYTAQDAFLLRLSADGETVQYSSYFGGWDIDDAQGLTFAPDSSVVLTGTTYSNNFPVSPNRYMAGSHGNLGNGEVFLIQFDSTGQSLQYGSYLGGSLMDYSKSVRVNDNFEAYVLGATQSSNFPTTTGSAVHGGGQDGFLSVFDLATGQVVGSSLFGGRYNDYPQSSGALHVEDNRATLSITTHSPAMPIVGNTYQSAKTNTINDAPWLAGIEVSTVLPAEILFFEAEWEVDHVALSWQSDISQAYRYELARQLPSGEWNVLQTGMAHIADGIEAYDDLAALQWVGHELRYQLRYQDADGTLIAARDVRLIPPISTRLSLRIAPNPARDRVQLFAQWPGVGRGTLNVFNQTGRTVFHTEFATDAQVWQRELDISGWPSGMYSLQLRMAGQGQVTERLLVH